MLVLCKVSDLLLAPWSRENTTSKMYVNQPPLGDLLKQGDWQWNVSFFLSSLSSGTLSFWFHFLRKQEHISERFCPPSESLHVLLSLSAHTLVGHMFVGGKYSPEIDGALGQDFLQVMNDLGALGFGCLTRNTSNGSAFQKLLGRLPNGNQISLRCLKSTVAL